MFARPCDKLAAFISRTTNKNATAPRILVIPLQVKLYYEPAGVVGCIVPWNYPILMATWKVLPPLSLALPLVLVVPARPPARLPAVLPACRPACLPRVDLSLSVSILSPSSLTGEFPPSLADW